MEKERLNLFFDFDDVVIKTRPRLEEQLYHVYKYASSRYWEELKQSIKLEYRQKLSVLRHKEKQLTQSTWDVSDLLEELYEKEMEIYADYIRKIEEVNENMRYIGINIDYALEVLNNGSNYADGDNPNSPYYIDYNSILDVKYAIPYSIEFIKGIMGLSSVNSSILSHKNCSRESLRKKVLINEYIGDIDVHVLDFHSDTFSTLNRKINSKAEYVMNLYGIDRLDENFILIDDSKTNILDWISHGGKGILYSPIYCEGFNWQISSLTYEAFLSCMNEEQKKLIKR